MTHSRRSFALAAIASALLCLAPPHARAAGPLFTTGDSVTPSGSTLVTFNDATGRSTAPPARPQDDTLLFGLADRSASESVSLLAAGHSFTKGVVRYNGVPSSPKFADAPEPSATATLSLGVLMLGGLVLLARNRLAASTP